tara:strand:+ start:27221 stop:27613 length:393 start_codon:yes stop_codon:yes gene_type:complete
MGKNNFDQIAKYEKAIAKKYGEEAIQNPRKYWDDDKEQDYLSQIKDLVSKEVHQSDLERKIEEQGFLVTEKLLNREGEFTTCPVCHKASRNSKDDVYIKKKECCLACYVRWVEDREERWNTGWRPNGNNN